MSLGFTDSNFPDEIMITVPFLTPGKSASACLLHLHIEYITCHQDMQMHKTRPLQTLALLAYSAKIMHIGERPRLRIDWLAATGETCCCSPRDAAMNIACL